MKRFVSLILSAFAGSSCFAQWQWKEPDLHEDQIYDLSVGKMSMRIAAERGGRIISLKYDGTEVLSQLKMPNMYGSTFWTSPQSEWNWPPVREHDSALYDVVKTDDGFVMTSQLSQKLPLRIRKSFSKDENEGCIVVTYSIINESDATRRVAPWEITRVPSEGIVFFDADVESITPAGLMPFIKKNDLAWYEIDHVEGQNRKINADGKGWLGYVNNGLLLVKRFPDLDPSQPAPGEAEIQVYVHQGKMYVEIESQGAYTELQPGQSLDWSVRWYLMPLEGEVNREVIGKILEN
ncbi:MAG: DUF4380 domain-containing protein [Bacteroidales bacterium]|nr:DUF4380 domain-containing protein [Bacteroidales bacterium]